MTVRINTKVPFFLWKMEEREVQLQGDVLHTKKKIKKEDGTEEEIQYQNIIEKTPSWMVFLVRHLPIILILVTADIGVQMWNGVGFLFAALFVYWYLFATKEKIKHFYPVAIGSVVAMTILGLLTGKLLYVNHVLSDVVYLFLLKMLADDYLFKNLDKYYSVHGKIGMFVYFPTRDAYNQKEKTIAERILIGLAALSLIVVVVNSALMYKEYKQEEEYKKILLIQQQKQAEEKKSKKAVLVIQKVVEENLTQEQVELRKQLGIIK